MGRLFGLSASVWFLILLAGCGGRNIPLDPAVPCGKPSSSTLPNYDRLSAKFLTDDTSHPLTNSGGNVVWGTRYYMESLLTAYTATGNPKYIQSFMQTGAWVMELEQTLSILDMVDPSAPGNLATSPTIDVQGWPTQDGIFSGSVAIPTPTGQTSLYAQNLDPSLPTAPIYLEVIPQSDGSLELAWVRYGPVLISYTVRTEADLDAIAEQPLVSNPAAGTSTLTRIKTTGLGLPAPGTYRVNIPIVTIWHEQTAGILLPFVRLLLLAKEHPGLIDENTQEKWTNTVVAVANSYTDHFLSDGSGGLRFHNLYWLPNSVADTDVAMDYMAAEATMRLFLYQLTSDPNQLAIAKGLVQHEQNSHWYFTSQGWLALQYWPDLVPWSNRAQAPPGSIWDSFQFDPATPAPVTDGVFFNDLLHFANALGLKQDVGIADSVYLASRATLEQYLAYGSDASVSPSAPILRADFPSMKSSASDGVTASDNPFAGAGYLAPEITNQLFITANWNWMLANGQTPQGWPIGYFLRAWARSEAASQGVCDAT